MFKTGEFVTKGKDRKACLDQRKKQIEEVVQKDRDDDNDDDDEDEMEKEKLECKTEELVSQLKKAERAEALA